MSTKVISAKVSEDDYDRLVERCNEKGCSISDYVRECCIHESNYEAVQESEEPSQVDELKKYNTIFAICYRY